MIINQVAAMARGEAAWDVLNAEFGAILAQRIVEAEAIDFLWEARVAERYVGQHVMIDFAEEHRSNELSRVAILSAIGGGWRVGMCVIDGDGNALELLWQRPFKSLDDAQIAWQSAH